MHFPAAQRFFDGRIWIISEVNHIVFRIHVILEKLNYVEAQNVQIGNRMKKYLLFNRSSRDRGISGQAY